MSATLPFLLGSSSSSGPSDSGAFHNAVTLDNASEIITPQSIKGVAEVHLYLDRPITSVALLPNRDSTKARRLRLLVFQDGSGSREISWPSNVLWDGDTTPALSAPAGSLTVIELLSIGSGLYYGKKLLSTNGAWVPPTSGGGAVGGELILDSFDRPNSTSLGVSSSAVAWDQRVGAFHISDNAATTVNGAGESVAVMPVPPEIGSAWKLRSLVRRAGGPSSHSLVVKWVNDTNFLLVEHKDGRLDIWKRVSGAWSQVATQGSQQAGAWGPDLPPTFIIGGGVDWELEIEANPTQVLVRANGVLQNRYTLTAGDQALFNSATRVGIRSNTNGSVDAGGSKFHDLRIIAA